MARGKKSFFVGHVLGLESTQGFFHTNYTPRACTCAMDITSSVPGRPPRDTCERHDHELSATHPENRQIPCESWYYERALRWAWR